MRRGVLVYIGVVAVILGILALVVRPHRLADWAFLAGVALVGALFFVGQRLFTGRAQGP